MQKGLAEVEFHASPSASPTVLAPFDTHAFQAVTVLVRPQQPRSGPSSFHRKIVARSLTEQFSWLSVLSLGSIDVLAFRLFTVILL